MKQQEKLLKIMIGIILIGGSYLIYVDKIDGIYINKVYTYRSGIDPMALKTIKTEYLRGEMVQGYSSFCKTREAKTFSQWSLHNEKIVQFTESEIKYLPVGCYPSDANGFIKFDIHPIPDDAEAGEHVFVGTVINELPDGRIRTYQFKTTPFNVIE